MSFKIDADACMECGTCKEVCPVDAPYLREKGGYRIDQDLCTECGTCAASCPIEVIEEK